MIDIVLGANYGREGKSTFTRWYSENKFRYDGVIKIGGYQPHTVHLENHGDVEFKMIPAARSHIMGEYKIPFVYIFPPCAFIDVDLLINEINMIDMSEAYILIDKKAVIKDKDGKMKHANDSNELFRNRFVDKIEITDTLPYINGTRPLLGNEECHFIAEAQYGYKFATMFAKKNQMLFNQMPNTMTVSGISHLLNLSPLDVANVFLITDVNSYLFNVTYNENATYEDLLINDPKVIQLKYTAQELNKKKDQDLALFKRDTAFLNACAIYTPDHVIVSKIDEIARDDLCLKEDRRPKISLSQIERIYHFENLLKDSIDCVMHKDETTGLIEVVERPDFWYDGIEYGWYSFVTSLKDTDDGEEWEEEAEFCDEYKDENEDK